MDSTGEMIPLRPCVQYIVRSDCNKDLLRSSPLHHPRFVPAAPPHHQRLSEEEEDGRSDRGKGSAKKMLVFPVQEALSQKRSSAMDYGSFEGTILSIEETPSQIIEHKHGEKKNSTSTDSGKRNNVGVNKTQETNIDVTLGGNCATEDRGPDSKSPMDNGQDNTELLCTSPNSNGSEAFEGQSKTFEGTSPEENASTDVQQDNVQEAMKLDDNTIGSCALYNDAPIVPESEDSTIAGFEEKNLAPEGHVVGKPNDDKLDHHETKEWFSGPIQTSGNTTNFIESDDDTNKDANVRRSRSKARRRRSKPKRRGNNISEDNNPEDKTSPAHGKDNNGVSPKRLKSQDQTQAAKRRSNASATTSPTCFQQDGNVPVVTRLDGHTASPCGSETSGVKVEKPNYRRSPFKSSNKSNGSWSATISVWIIVFLILPLTQVQASTAEPQWRQSLFCTKNVSLFNQILTFRNMESREYCSFNSTNAPSVHNCSQLRSWVIVKNEFCVEMLTEGQENMDCRMEYGNNQNGESMSSERGAMLNEEAVMDKLWQYSHPPVTHPPATHPPDRAAEPQLDKDNPDIVKIFLGVLLPAIILALLFGILYKFSPKFRSNVNSLISSLRNCWTNSSRKTDSNANPSAIPLQSVSSTNGAVNGHLLKNNII